MAQVVQVIEPVSKEACPHTWRPGWPRALYAPETLRSPPPLVVSLLIDLRLWKESLMVVNKRLSDFSSQSMSSVSLFSMASASPSVKVGTGSGVPSLHVSSSPTETEIKYRDGLT